MTKQRKTVIKMSLWELFILAVGLSMDAFAVSVCKGLSVKKLKAKHMLTVGAYFGGFQALMPEHDKGIARGSGEPQRFVQL